MSTATERSTLLKVTGLKQYFVYNRGFFSRSKSVVKAVDGVDLEIKRFETLGLVGESGCGKSTLGRSILRLIEPSYGRVFFDNTDVLAADTEQLRKLRRKMQIIFQDPFASLNPRMSVGRIIEEPLIIHKIGENAAARRERVHELLNLVGLRQESLGRYPHEFSGGQRQRVGIARALAVEPEFIVCDEPISALDVSIQAQIINLMQDLQYKLGLTYLFIAHDLHVVKHMASEIGVMYLGNIAEIGAGSDVFENALHPYTQALLSAVPATDPSKTSKRIALKGEIPSPINPPSGCKFHTRCPYVMPKCKDKPPELLQVGGKQKVACYLYE